MSHFQPPKFSNRGEARLRESSPLMQMLCCVFSNQYSRASPTGPVSLGVAENSLMHADLLKFCETNFKLDPVDLTYGTRLKGSQRLFLAIQKLYAQAFKPCIPIEVSSLITGAGVGSMMDLLISMLCDDGDGVMLQAPYYSGFDKDMDARNGVKAVPVDGSAFSDPGAPETLQAFEHVLKTEKSRKIRAVILCNPHNPLGFCYKRETIIEYLKFVEKHDLHLIVDEIYGLSVFDSPDPSAVPFTSVLSIDVEKEAQCHPGRVHHLYGASKDFCMNGLRIGVLHTRNERLADAFTATALFNKIGSPSDSLFSALVNSSEHLDWFLATNRERLSHAYRYATRWLEENEVPYRPSHAGHFIWIDLRKWLPLQDPKTQQALTSDKEKEAALFMHLLESGVYVAPGAFYHAKEHGFFRLTFSVEEDIMAVGLKRMQEALNAPCCCSTASPDAVSVNGKEVEALTSAFTTSELADELASEVPCHC